MQWSDREKLMTDVLSKFPNLKERLNLPARILSGGERRMLSLARGLMCSPKLLLIDEPSLGLSPLINKQIFEIIRQINKESNTTIFLVEQNARMALSLADRAYVLQTGSIIRTGTGQELLEDPEVREAYLGH